MNAPAANFRRRSARAGFTLMEIAICLAIIGIALVAIVGILPYGLNAQRDNRESTVIGQDATVLMDAIRGAAVNVDDLTNYVIAITNYQSVCKVNGGINSIVHSNVIAYTYTNVAIFQDGSSLSGNYQYYRLTNGYNILGVLSTPLLVNTNFGNTNAWNVQYVAQPWIEDGVISNHIVAYFHAFSGPATEKLPQDNDIIRGDSFAYRVIVVNTAPPRLDDNAYSQELAYNQHEIRLAFTWPLLPNGAISSANPTISFRSTVAGQLLPDPYSLGPTGPNLRYFYRSQSFLPTNAPSQ